MFKLFFGILDLLGHLLGNGIKQFFTCIVHWSYLAFCAHACYHFLLWIALVFCVTILYTSSIICQLRHTQLNFITKKERYMKYAPKRIRIEHNLPFGHFLRTTVYWQIHLPFASRMPTAKQERRIIVAVRFILKNFNSRYGNFRLRSQNSNHLISIIIYNCIIAIYTGDAYLWNM